MPTAASQSADSKTMLSPLFVEPGSLEELVLAARAQARGQSDGTLWRYITAGLITAALILVAVVVLVH